MTRAGPRFDDVVAHLYSVPPDEFIAERDAAVGRAKEAADRQLAVRIGKLRKPTVAAWLVNLLAHQRPDLVGELLALGDELRSESLRELSIRRRDTVSALAREARALAIAAGRQVREKLPLAEVEQTLTAALADGYVADEVRAGVLTRPTNYAGFGELPRPQLRLLKGGKDAVRDESRPERASAPETSGRAVKADRSAKVAERAEQAVQAAKVAERKRAVENARATKAARRELLAASLQLVDAQAKREAALKALASADRAIAAAQQRADEAKATLDKLNAHS